jgi:hypothetical protein
VRLEVRSGGPATGFKLVSEQMYTELIEAGIWARGWRGDREHGRAVHARLGMRSWRRRQGHGPAAPRCRRRGRRSILIGAVSTAGRAQVAQRAVPGGGVTALRSAALTWV